MNTSESEYDSDSETYSDSEYDTYSSDYCGMKKLYYDMKKTKLSEEYYVNNGKIQGIYKSYYIDGEICEEINYIDGIKHGICKLYDCALFPLVELIYINDKCQKICKVFDKNGNYMYNRDSQFIKRFESLYYDYDEIINNFLIKL